LKAVELSRAGGAVVEVWLPGPARNAVHSPKVAFPLAMPPTGPTPELEDEATLVLGELVLEVLVLELEVLVLEVDELDELWPEGVSPTCEAAVPRPLAACEEACDVWEGRPPVIAAAVPAPSSATAAIAAVLADSSLASIDGLLATGSAGWVEETTAATPAATTAIWSCSSATVAGPVAAWTTAATPA
jgi:hypothetical protein